MASSFGNADTVVSHMLTDPDWLAAAAAHNPEATFVTTSDRSWSFAEVDDAAGGLAGALRDAGAAPATVVAVWATNDIGTVQAMFAVPRTGATLLLLNTRLAPPELLDQLNRAGVSVVLASIDVADMGGRQIVPATARSAPIAGHLPAVDHEAVIAFTSGTSGRARGVVLTHGNLAASAAASAQHLEHTAEDRWLAVLPLFHVGGASILWRSAKQGSEVVLHRNFDPAETAAALHEVTLASVVGTMLSPILAADPGPYLGLKAVLVGGGSTNEDILRSADAAGLPVLSTYGMTETASQIATAPLGDGPRRRAVPLPGAEIRIASDGEIEVTGPMVSDRYLGEASRTGWLSTGDVGEIDEQGFLRVLGRKDDLIVTGGENVHPAEVEAALESVQGVRQAAVVGVPDPDWGQSVVAVVATNRTADDLAQHLREHLAGYKVPKRWHFVEELPRNALGKVDRKQMLELIKDADRG